MNQDQAVRCIEIAQEAIQDGDNAKARKFLLKSLQLHETTQAKNLLAKLQTQSTSEDVKADSTATPKHEHAAPKVAQAKVETVQETAAHEATYSKEDVQEVSRILSVKMDFYAVLQLEKGCSEDEIKKAYRRAPGSVEAFKVISKAYQILIDADKRRAFDASGLDPDNRTASQPSGQSQFSASQFESEISPEELFEMFFGRMGGGMRGTTFSAGPGLHFRVHQPNVRYRQPSHRTHEQVLHEQRRHEQMRRQRAAEVPVEEVSLRPFLTLLAILFFSLLTSLFSAWDPPVPRFALARQHPYIQPMRTSTRNVPYYVDPDNFPFVNRDLDSGDRRRLREVETQVEQSYLRNLQTRCQYEMQLKRERLQEARGFWGVDSEALREANEMRMEACDALRGWR